MRQAVEAIRHDHESVNNMAFRPESLNRPLRSHQEDSWVEISSQPSSSSLSSANEDFTTSGLTVERPVQVLGPRRTRRVRPRPHIHLHSTLSTTTTDSQEDNEDSESESDHPIASSNEELLDGLDKAVAPTQTGRPTPRTLPTRSPRMETRLSGDDDDEDENRTAVNCPIRRQGNVPFTPRPNAFNHQSADSGDRVPSHVPGSYFPPARPSTQQSVRHSYSSPPNHLPRNVLSPTYVASLPHEEALRSSLTTLLSCAAAARGLPKSVTKRQVTDISTPGAVNARGNRIEPASLRLVPESALPLRNLTSPTVHEPIFQPTIRRSSTSTTASSSQHKRKAASSSSRGTSHDRRSAKKMHRYSSADELTLLTPTLFTWVISAGVVVFLSALSFSAGYSIGKEAGRLDTGQLSALTGADAEDTLISCAREAGKTGLGLKRSLARSAVAV